MTEAADPDTELDVGVEGYVDLKMVKHQKEPTLKITPRSETFRLGKK